MTASPAHAETLTMICGGYSVAFSPGNLTSHAPKKDRDYPITKVDRQNGRTVVSGKTQYGKITAFFSKDGHSSIVWTNGKDVVLHQPCAENIAATPVPRIAAAMAIFKELPADLRFFAGGAGGGGQAPAPEGLFSPVPGPARLSF